MLSESRDFSRTVKKSRDFNGKVMRRDCNSKVNRLFKNGTFSVVVFLQLSALACRNYLYKVFKGTFLA